MKMVEIHIKGKTFIVEKEVEDLINEYRKEREELLDKYHEIINLIEDKHPGETRHQTAVKYMKNYTEFLNQMSSAIKEMIKE